MNLAAAAQAFITVFAAELPDKTMVATIVLVTRYRHPLAVWAGAAAAFTLHVTVAVVAGSLLTLLPDLAVKLATAALFMTGAVLLWRSATSQAAEARSELDTADGQLAPEPTWKAAVGSFGLIAVAEWGDLTQLATAGLAGSTGAPVAVAIGAVLALWSVCGLATIAGRSLIKVLPLEKVQRAASMVFAGLAVLTLVTAL